MLVSLYCQDRGEKVAQFRTGSYSIGRSKLLKCQDSRISRNHCLLTITNDKVTITSTHTNPVFHKSAATSCLTRIKDNMVQELQNLDEFSFLPSHYCYKIIFSDSDSQEELDENFLMAKESKNETSVESMTNDEASNITTEEISLDFLKRKNEEDDHSIIKKLKHDASDSSDFLKDLPGGDLKQEMSVPNEELKNDFENDNKTSCIVECAVRQEKNEIIDELNVGNDLKNSDNQPSTSSNENDVDILSSTSNDQKFSQNQPSTSSIKGENNDVSSSNVESTSTVQINNETFTMSNDNDSSRVIMTIRDRCWYGESCYRINTNHKKKLSHPGDPDYDSDDNDQRPECKFGKDCYRRSKIHRLQFKHPKTQVKLKVKKPNNKINQKPKQDNESSEDDYDYEDPFINDDSSDDYSPDDYDNYESDWESDDLVEEEDTKRVLKEAKRFTKNRQKD